MTLCKDIPSADQLIENLHVGGGSDSKVKLFTEFFLEFIQKPSREDHLINRNFYFPGSKLINQDKR